MTPGQVRHLLVSGQWNAVHQGVYQSAAHVQGPTTWVRAAGLWGGANATIAGPAAVWWWGLSNRPPDEVHLVIPLNEHRQSKPGITVIRRHIPTADVALHRGAQVTGLALTVLAGSVQLGSKGPALLDRALQTRLHISDLRSCYYRNLGMHGLDEAGRLLRAAADKTAAASERLFIGLLKAAGLRGWRVNYSWDPANPWTTIDVAFVRELLAIEIDGWAWHHSPDRFQRDRSKQNRLIAAGWKVLRFTWFDLTSRPDDVVRQVLEGLSRVHAR
jgi:very-short-patch-repair endonuclease